MAWLPLSGIVPQATESGNQANGYVLKFYEPGTTTPLAVATDSTGGTTTTEFVLDVEGYTTLSANRVIPHVDQTYKEVLYLNQADADANATGSAVYVIDNMSVGDTSLSSQVSTNTANIATNAADIATNASNIAAISLSPFINSIDTSSSDGDNVVVTAGSCTDSAGSKSLTVTAQSANIKGAIIGGTGNMAGTVAADTTYYLFVVSEADGSNPKLAFDTSLTATQALADWGTQTGNTYTLYRLISFALTDATPDIIAFSHEDETWLYASPYPLDHQALGETTAAAVLATLSVPLGVKVSPISEFYLTSSSTVYTLVTSPELADTAPTSTIYTITVTGTSGNAYIGYNRTNTGGQLRYRSDTASLKSLSIGTSGWVYKR